MFHITIIIIIIIVNVLSQIISGKRMAVRAEHSVHACNSSTWKAEGSRSLVQGQYELQKIPHLQNTKEKGRKEEEKAG